jgi:hypothetical protein
MARMIDATWLVMLATVGACGVGEAPPPGGGATPTCAEYCDEVMSICSDANAQYADHAACTAYCEGVGVFGVGTTEDADTNTIGCRIYHAGAAASDPATHCLHAGPTGAGVCGAWCDNYCDMAMTHCTGANVLYESRAACEGACAGFATDGTQGDADGDTVQCRLYHLGAAAGDQTHCAHGASDGGGVCVD